MIVTLVVGVKCRCKCSVSVSVSVSFDVFFASHICFQVFYTKDSDKDHETREGKVLPPNFLPFSGIFLPFS